MESEYPKAFREALESRITISPEFCEKTHRFFELAVSKEEIVEEETPSEQTWYCEKTKCPERGTYNAILWCGHKDYQTCPHYEPADKQEEQN